jgi:hypothetical protein
LLTIRSLFPFLPADHQGIFRRAEGVRLMIL